MRAATGASVGRAVKGGNNQVARHIDFACGQKFLEMELARMKSNKKVDVEV